MIDLARLAAIIGEHRSWKLDDSSPLVTRWLCSCGEAFPLTTSRAQTSHDLHVAAAILVEAGSLKVP